MRRALTLIPLLLASGCAWGPGEPFGLISSTLSFGVGVPEGRDAGDGFQKLDTDYQARFVVAGFEIEEVALIQPATAAVEFDPANPPPGFTICHNGHCDTESGEQLTYEEVAEQLAGGGAGAAPVVTFAVEAEADVLGGGDVCLAGCPDGEGPVSVELVEISRAEVLLAAGTIEGVVRDGRVPARITGEVPFRVSYSEEAGDSHVTVRGPLELATGNDEPPEIDVALSLALDGSMFDGIDFAALTRDGSGVIDLDLSENAAARERFFENLAAATLEADIARTR